MYLYANFVVWCSFLCLVVSSKFKNNITDFSKCKTHITHSEVSYTKFFQITDQFRGNNSLEFDFHFAVLAPRDAHILLGPSTSISRSDPVYEIVLGAGLNSFSDIRRLQKAAVKASAKTKDLLSALDVRAFWLHVSKDGLIQVGREGEELAFLLYRDPDPLPLQVFSFCTWPGVDAKWYYDCQREDGTISTSQEIEETFTPTEKLRRHLLLQYDPYVRPSLNPEDLTVVYMGLVYERVHLDEMKSQLTIHGTMQLQWLDEKINWSPDDFDGIDKLHVHFREIWQPELVIYNSASPSTSGAVSDLMLSTKMVITSEGFVQWTSRVVVCVWCDATGLGHWPNDQHTCDLQTGTQDKHLILLPHNTTIQPPNSPSEWQVTSLQSGLYFIPTPWNGPGDHYANTFVMNFKLQRTTDAYTAIYFTPLLVISVSILLSFWVSPMGPLRISLSCFQLVLLSLMLTKLGSFIPAHPLSVPYIVLLYSYGLIAALVSLAFSILIINLSRTKQKKPLPYFIHKILSLCYVQTILYVRCAKFSESYDKLTEENINTKLVNIQDSWIMLGILLDRFLFLIYVFLILITLFKQY